MARKIRRWLLRFLVLAVLYFLSFGPALLLNKRGTISVSTLQIVYFPLVMVTQIVPGGQWLTEQYMRLWVGENPLRGGRG